MTDAHAMHHDLAPAARPDPRPAAPGFGALVISLDFELHWGVRDRVRPGDPYVEALLGARAAVPRMLETFEKHGLAATWATVGFLFAGSRDEMEAYEPTVRPRYESAALDPFGEPVGASEEEDPLHFAPSLIRAVLATDRQEVATHTFSHYYCLEAGQDEAAFDADLRSAVSIARTFGVTLRSIVLPRNQVNPAYADVLRRHGIVCYRGTRKGWMYDARSHEASRRPLLRIARLVNAYLPLGTPLTTPWAEIPQGDGLFDVPSNTFLRPYAPRLRRLEPLRIRMITKGIERAAERGEVYHLWWHPHNFGLHTEDNLAVLDAVGACYARCRDRYGMRSLTMGDVVDLLTNEPRDTDG